MHSQTRAGQEQTKTHNEQGSKQMTYLNVIAPRPDQPYQMKYPHACKPHRAAASQAVPVELKQTPSTRLAGCSLCSSGPHGGQAASGRTPHRPPSPHNLLGGPSLRCFPIHAPTLAHRSARRQCRGVAAPPTVQSCSSSSDVFPVTPRTRPRLGARYRCSAWACRIAAPARGILGESASRRRGQIVTVIEVL